MGDRGNIKITYEENQSIYFYTHWDGSNLPVTVKNALKKQTRWNDAPYLARIVFCELVKLDSVGSTGYGIAPYLIDNEHKIVEIDCENQKVNFRFCDDFETIDKTFTFEEYISKEDKELMEIFHNEDLN